MQISKFRLAAAGAITAATFSLIGAGTAYAVQDHLTSAKDHLNQSLTDLQFAEPDTGGHREQAIQLVHLAIDQITDGIDYAELHQ